MPDITAISSKKYLLWENIIFYILLVLQLVPLFTGKYFATQDGPSHLYNAAVLKDFLLHADSQYHHFFYLNPKPSPNWLTHGLLLLLSLLAPFYLAEKLLLAIYVICMPLAMRYLLQSVNPASGFFAILMFPLVYNVTVYYGFYNFCYSIIFFLLAAGYWIRNYGLFTIRQGIVFFVLTTLLLLSHPLPYAILLLFIAFLFIPFIIQDIRKDFRMLMRRLVSTALPLLPTIAFAVYYALSGNGKIVSNQEKPQDVLMNLVNSSYLHYLGQYDGHLISLLGYILLAMGAVAIIMAFLRKTSASFPGILLFTIAFIPLTMITPQEFANGSIIGIRMALFFMLLLICLSATATYPRIVKIVLSLLFALFVLIYHHMQTHVFSAISKDTDEVMKLESHLQPGKLMIQYNGPILMQFPDNTDVNTYINPFFHISGYLAADCHLVSLDNYEADKDYFPLKWQKRLNAEHLISGREVSPPDLADYERRCGMKIDYVMLWNTSEKDTIPGLNRQLQQHYKQVPLNTTAPLKLYERL